MKVFSSNELPFVKYYKVLSNDKKLNYLYIFLGVVTLGIFFLISYWFKDIYYKFFKIEKNIQNADYIMFVRNDNYKILSPICKTQCKINPYG